jgi:hypothetical protein
MLGRALYNPKLDLLLLFLGVIFLAATFAVVIVCSDLERRPHFWRRVGLSVLAAPASLLALVVVAQLGFLPDGVVEGLALLLVFSCVPGLILLPAVLFCTPDAAPGADGRGPGPGGPPSAPISPRMPPEGLVSRDRDETPSPPDEPSDRPGVLAGSVG